MDGPAIDTERVIADLRELARRTGDERGAQRLCWGKEWRQAREFLGELLAELGVEARRDPAGNLWARLDGAAAAAPALAIGSHLDSVPDGGWLDGALGVMAGVGVLRAWAAADEPPPQPLALIDWADEEGARFGRSLFGSSAFAATLDPAELASSRDADGRTAQEVLGENGVELGSLKDRMGETGLDVASNLIPELTAYLELHIEQGPVLEAERHPVAAVTGCVGIERHRLRFRGQAAHAGTTPMEGRRDAGLAAAETALAVERVARDHAGIATTGSLELRPGIPTAVAGEANLLVDLRHPDGTALERMFWAALEAGRSAAAARGCAIEEELVWRIEPVRFDAGLVAAAVEVARAAGGRPEPLTSGALHDAAEVARILPAAMLFCPSKAGLSHAGEEDTEEADLRTAIDTFGRLAGRVLAR
jgi:hydantoinase/carbamoylase family amidase